MWFGLMDYVHGEKPLMDTYCLLSSLVYNEPNVGLYTRATYKLNLG